MLFKVARILSGPASFAAKCEDALEEVARAAGVEQLVIRLLNQELEILELVAHSPQPGVVSPTIPIHGISAVALKAGEPVVVNDYLSFSEVIPARLARGVKSAVCYPIKMGTTNIGVVNVSSLQADYFTPERVRLIGTLTEALVVLLENARLQNEVERRAQELEVLSKIVGILAGPSSFGLKCQDVLGEVAKIASVENAVLRLLDPEGLNLNLVAHAAEAIRPPLSIPLEGLSAIALAQGHAVVANDYQSHPETIPGRIPWGAMSVASLPVRTAETTFGVVNFGSTDLNHFTPDRMRLINAVVDGLGVLLENARLHDETNKLALALESIGDAVSFTDRQGKFQFVNRAWEEMHGYADHEAIGKHFTILIKDARDNRKAEHIQDEAYQSGWSGELKRVRSDGGEFDVRKTLTPVKKEDGSIIGMISVTQDITEQKREEAQLRETARLVAIGELAAGVAHKINNPLAIILGTTELLERADVSPAIEPRLRNIQTQANLASRIVRNLLAFARRGGTIKEYMDVQPVLEQALELKDHELRMSSIKVVRHWATDLPYTMVDKHQMIEALVGILNNSQQSMVEAHGGGELVISTAQADGSIQISISDDGVGISPEDMPKIFDPFFTTKVVGEGAGLGLSTCYGIVSLHGGKIWAESAPGEGRPSISCCPY